MKKTTKIILLTLVATSTILFCSSVLAADLTPGDETVKLENPIGTTDIRVLAGQILKTALGILGSLTLVAIVYGGFMWLTSGGNQERVKKGTQTMMWAVAGVFLVFSSYAIINTIITGIGATGEGLELGDKDKTAASTAAATGTESNVCDGKTCWYKVGSSSVNQYNEPGKLFSPTKSKFSTKSACFVATEEVDHKTGSKQGIYIKVSYNGSDIWFRTNIGSTEYWKKVSDPKKDCKSFPK